MEIHSAKRDEELINQTPTKLSKKEKKKQKEAKKLLKLKKLDEKVSYYILVMVLVGRWVTILMGSFSLTPFQDLDTSEIKAETKEKKKKKKFLF